MPGLVAPARRVGLFMHDNTAASFTADGGKLFNAAINWARGASGSLSGSMVISPSGNSVNLTAEGILDWAHWGMGSPTSFDHKRGISPQIGNYSRIGTSSPSWLQDNPTTFSWTDGTPTISASNTPTGVHTNGVGNGFEITVPANTNLNTLKLHVGLWRAQGKLEATLSDGSAPPFTNTSLTNNSGTSNGIYTIQFRALASGQILRIKYTVLTDHYAPYGNVTLEAATLE